MRSKSIFVFIMSVILSLLIASCNGGGSSSSTPPPATPTSPVTPLPTNTPDLPHLIVFSTNSINIGIGDSQAKSISIELENPISSQASIDIISSNTGIFDLSQKTCILNTANNFACSVQVIGKAIGTASLTATASGYQSVSISVNVSHLLPMKFENVKRFTQTIYYGKSYPNVEFTFKNNSSKDLALGNVTLSKPNTATFTMSLDNCSNQSIKAQSTCKIEYSNIFVSQPTSDKLKLNFSEKNHPENKYEYAMDLYAVEYRSGYAPLNVIKANNTNISRPMYVISFMGGVQGSSGSKPISFSRVANTNEFVGTLITQGNVSPSDYELDVTSQGSNFVLYFPQMYFNNFNAGSRVYLSYDAKLPSAINGSPEAKQDVPYSLFEMNSYHNAANANEHLYFMNVSYVDNMSWAISTYGFENGSKENKHTGVKDVTLTGDFILNSFKDHMSKFKDVYDMPEYFHHNSSGKLVSVLSPTTVFGPSSLPSGFNAASWNTYTNDLWEYYTTHKLVIDGSEISKNNSCRLEGQVKPDGKMHFAPSSSSTCPPDPSNTNTFTVDKIDFNYQGFFSAFADQDVYGKNGTYKSLLKFVAGSQAVGFFPYCNAPTNFMYGKDAIKSRSADFFTPQYTCLTNYSLYGESVINQYDKVVHDFFDAYGYGYDDTVGIDSAVSGSSDQYALTLYFL